VLLSGTKHEEERGREWELTVAKLMFVLLSGTFGVREKELVVKKLIFVLLSGPKIRQNLCKYDQKS